MLLITLLRTWKFRVVVQYFSSEVIFGGLALLSLMLRKITIIPLLSTFFFLLVSENQHEFNKLIADMKQRRSKARNTSAKNTVTKMPGLFPWFVYHFLGIITSISSNLFILFFPFSFNLQHCSQRTVCFQLFILALPGSNLESYDVVVRFNPLTLTRSFSTWFLQFIMLLTLLLFYSKESNLKWCNVVLIFNPFTLGGVKRHQFWTWRCQEWKV